MAENHYETDKTDLMWMKMALTAASRAEITEHAARKPSVGCIIRRSRRWGSPICLAVGWNGFLPNTREEELEIIKNHSFKCDIDKAEQKRDNMLTAELGLHAEANALQHCTKNPELATVYVTHVPCYLCAKQLVAHKVGRVIFLYWMEGAETTISLFRKFDITCIAFDKRDLVLKDFSPNFLKFYSIVVGSTREKTPPEQYFLDSRDAPKQEGSSSAQSGSDSGSDIMAIAQDNKKLRDELSEVKNNTQSNNRELAAIKQSVDEMKKIIQE